MTIYNDDEQWDHDGPDLSDPVDDVNDDEYFERDVEGIDEDGEPYIDFADPGGNSALRAATASNPRNLPCPNCGGENRLTPADRARGYQCDSCADRAERGFDY